MRSETKTCAARFGLCDAVCVAVVALTACFSAQTAAAAVDLAGEPHTVTSAELSEIFVNSSGTTADLTIDVSSDTAFRGTISGNIRLVKTGSAVLEVATVNDFTGGTSLEAGTLNFTTAGSLGNGTVTVAAGATLALGAVVECSNPIHLMSKTSYVKFNVNDLNGFFSGDITGESGITFRPQIYAKGGNYRFTGSITIPNGTLATPGLNFQSSAISFYGPVSVNRVSQSSSSNRPALRFYSAENEWTSFSLNRASNQTYAPYFSTNAIPRGSYISLAGKNSRGISIGGNQDFRYISAKSGYSASISASAASCSVVTLGSETESTGKSQTSTGYVFSGPMSIVYAPEQSSSEWTVASGASTMTGSLIVSNGVMSVEGTATFANVTNVTVKAGATFSCTSTGENPLGSVADFDIASTSTLELGGGIELSPSSFLVNGRAPSVTGWFTGSDNENPVEGDQQTLSQLKGAGRIYIPFQGSEAEATWDGGAGESDTLVTTPANWEDDEVPDFSGGLSVTFAADGRVATFTSPVTLKKIEFSAPDGFSLRAQGDSASIAISDGISAAANSGEAAVTNVVDVPVTVNAAQDWQTPADTVLEIRGPVASESDTGLVFGGAGTYCVYSTNTFTGPVSLTNGVTCVYSGRGAFGDAAAGGEVLLNYSSGARLALGGTTIEKDFRLLKPSGNNYGGITFAAGTTNVFAGRFTVGSNWTPRGPGGAYVVFAGGGSFGSYFRPEGGLSMTFAGEPYSFGTGMQFYGRSYYVQVSSNTMDSVYIRVNTTVHLEAPIAFKNGPDLTMANESGKNPSYLYLHGCDQSFGSLLIANPHAEISTPVGQPATFAFEQTSDWTPAADLFQGPVSLSKGGSATVTIESKMDTTGGDLGVTGGTLAFGASGSLASVTNIAVRGSDAMLSLASKANLPLSKRSTMRLAGGGKVEIPAGMTLRVAELWIDGVRKRNDVYNSSTLPESVTGSGTIMVGLPGMHIRIL